MSIGGVTAGGCSATPAPDPVPALQGMVRREEMDLQDWLSCVSASTPKGRAEIQSLSAQISAARAEISRAQQSQSATHSTPAQSLTYSAPTAVSKAATQTQPGQLDVWA